MTDDETFTDFLRRIRAGDEQAAAELVRRYEPFIRRAVRLRLEDRRLGRLFDSMDVCQSVLGSFFVRAAVGQFELDTPEQLVKLLATMARNKLASQARKEYAGRRDHRRVEASGPAALDQAAPGSSPSRQASAKEMLQEVHRRLSPDERRLVELRTQGHDWAQIAAEVGSTPAALRQKFCRALNRVTRELGLDEVGDA